MDCDPLLAYSHAPKTHTRRIGGELPEPVHLLRAYRRPQAVLLTAMLPECAADAGAIALQMLRSPAPTVWGRARPLC
jgi:hypothetical protein